MTGREKTEGGRKRERERIEMMIFACFFYSSVFRCCFFHFLYGLVGFYWQRKVVVLRLLRVALFWVDSTGRIY